MSALEHRGPDHAGLRADGNAALGATRLSVRGGLDGRQPLVDPESGVVAVCNGEIDNHADLKRWLTERGRPVPAATDVAVLPGLYLELGERLVDELAGNFALAIWDPRSQRLILARDRAGERPLFYAQQRDELVFASEVAALAADPSLSLSLDPAALAGYVRRGCFIAPGSPFREIRKLGPGELVTFDAAGTARRRYWSWSIGRASRKPPDADRFDTIFREAVRRQADVDVPCGVFLSGGLDSSLVAAVARQVHPRIPLRAFSIRFREASYDESDWARRVAAELGIPCDTVEIEPEGFPAEVERLVACVGEPLADPAWVPTALLARRAARDVTVALVGEGGDELFGGYPTYMGAGLADTYLALPQVLRRWVRTAIERWPTSERKVTLSFLLRRFVDGIELEPLARHLLWTASVPPTVVARLGLDPSQAPPPARDPAEAGAVLDRLQRFDLETTLAEGLLTKADRAGMQSALELRAPFLDRDVFDFAATLPPRDRVRGLETKVFLKRYAERYLPKSVVHRRKRGLSVPVAAWFRGPLRGWAEEKLGAELGRIGIDARAARTLLDEHVSRRADHGRTLWTLVVLSEWLRWASSRVEAENSSRTRGAPPLRGTPVA